MVYQRSSFHVVHTNKKSESRKEVNTKGKRIPKQEKKLLGERDSQRAMGRGEKQKDRLKCGERN